MRQTKQYKLNLIEKEDTFSPDPLNENMEKVEAQLNENMQKVEAQFQAVRAEAASGDAALDLRLRAIEAHKAVFGSVTSATNTEYLGFTPKVVIGFVDHTYSISMKDYYLNPGLRVVEGGFMHDGTYAACRYIAII